MEAMEPEARVPESGPGGAAERSSPTRTAPLTTAALVARLGQTPLIRVLGRVSRITGLLCEVRGLRAPIGGLCRIGRHEGEPLPAEVVGFHDGRLFLMPLGVLAGVSPGDQAWAAGGSIQVPIGPGLLGRVLGPLGEPLDGKGPLQADGLAPLHRSPPPAMARERITAPLVTGIRAIDGLLTCGQGQRLGIFAGSGIGKSTLLGMIARCTTADVNVIGLIGERGREVQEFLQADLGAAGLERSVVVVATSDLPPLLRRQAALLATGVAESFRDRGQAVLLMMDSLTRFAMAQREIGLAVGEPPTTRGYPPSTFALLPQLLERAGPGAGTGSITGLYTVLVEGDDLNEPVTDAARAILDGHIVLSRDLADRGQYPPIDVLASVSRVMPNVVTPAHLEVALQVREALGAARDVEDLVRIGAYVSGSDPVADWALKHLGAIQAFLRQGVDEGAAFTETVQRLQSLWTLPRPRMDGRRAEPGAVRAR
jgi:FliI/YscN family ATPase